MQAILEWLPALLFVVVIYWFIMDPVTVLIFAGGVAVVLLFASVVFKLKPLEWIKSVLSKLFSAH